MSTLPNKVRYITGSVLVSTRAWDTRTKRQSKKIPLLKVNRYIIVKTRKR